jgi:cytochrome P450
VALLASDNRDERQFPDAETFDITREPGRSRHLAFGTGIHACLGSALARLEGQIAFTALLSRLPNLALATPRDAVEWRAGTFLRGLTRLPVMF